MEKIGGSPDRDGGLWVKISHETVGDFWRTGYYHLTNDDLYNNLQEGDFVFQGTAFVTSGKTGPDGTPYHLHFNYLLGTETVPNDVIVNARNPMVILPYNNDEPPYQGQLGTIWLDENGYVAMCSFSVYVQADELDLDRVEVEAYSPDPPYYDKLVIDISQRFNIYDREDVDGEFYAHTDQGYDMKVFINPHEFANSEDGDQRIDFLFNIQDAWSRVDSGDLIAKVYDLGGRHFTVEWRIGVDRWISDFVATGGYHQVSLSWNAGDFLRMGFGSGSTGV